MKIQTNINSFLEAKKKLLSFEESSLENPEKADLDKDGKLSDYELKRGKAIEKSMMKKKKSKLVKEANEDDYYYEEYSKGNMKDLIEFCMKIDNGEVDDFDGQFKDYYSEKGIEKIFNAWFEQNTKN